MTAAVSTVRPHLDAAVTATSVHCRGLRKQFPSGAAALRDVDVEFPDGRITVLLGPSGCGKTTLLRCIAGLERPSAGTVSIAGADVTAVDAGRRGVAMVFQNYGLYPDKTAFRNIEYPLRMARVPKRERHDRVHEVAALLRIEQLLGRRPAHLSGGEKQRVGIGRALVRRPGVLLLDEPLSSLDAALRTAMRSELHALQRHIGTTMIYVTHDQTEALSLADRLVVMRDGRVEQCGAPEEVFAAPATTFVAGFLGAMNVIDAAALEWIGTTGGDAVTAGIRPEDIVLGPPPAAGCVVLRGPVVHTELLGTERLVHVRFAHDTVRIRIGAADPVPEDVVAHAAARHVHRFDVNGRRIS